VRTVLADTKGLEGMRIAVVLPRMELGGAARQALLLARYLRDAAGARVRVLGLGGEEPGFQRPGAAALWCDEQNLPWERLSERTFSTISTFSTAKLPLLVAVARWLRQKRVELVLPYTAAPNFFCGLAWRAASCRACVWNQRTFQEDYWPGPAQRLAARLCTAFISNTREGATFLIERLGVPAERGHHHPNGVALPPPRRTRSEWRAALGIPEDAFVAVTHAQMHRASAIATGRIEREKDPETLIRAWTRLTQNGFRGILVVAGTLEPARSAGLLSDAGATGARVLLPGEIDDVAGLLTAADLGLFSSWKEGMPNSLLELMAAGLPIVSTDLPGTREALGAAYADELVRPGDDEAFAARVRAFADDPDRCQREGDSHRRRALSEFAPERMLTRTTEILETAIADQLKSSS
jgi:glycosyltransferase involved in cell wall biosynthesis